ncbi:hypothetical protein C4561_03590 [candidate division WWE3 bacterium]|jgi:hypothetical protein|uniref:Uncharacterized protein n=1 Tax=candidate division WWE3 bacterium TaxID=2053526 RepID=A0A3A4ZC44_UNCKA|nr:MAG: hypothetical protein C4561_03590 [candidate division WWE3 bacterium]
MSIPLDHKIGFDKALSLLEERIPTLLADAGHTSALLTDLVGDSNTCRYYLRFIVSPAVEATYEKVTIMIDTGNGNHVMEVDFQKIDETRAAISFKGQFTPEELKAALELVSEADYTKAADRQRQIDAAMAALSG